MANVVACIHDSWRSCTLIEFRWARTGAKRRRSPLFNRLESMARNFQAQTGGGDIGREHVMKRGSVRIWADGLITGVIGFAVIVVFFVVFDLASGRPLLYTAALLGEALFHGLDDPAQFIPSRESALAFNGVRLILYLTIGVIASWLASIAERGARLWYVATVLFIFALFHVIAGKIWLTEPVRDSLPEWSVVVGTFLAAAAMIAYLVLRTYPRLPDGRAFRE